MSGQNGGSLGGRVEGLTPKLRRSGGSERDREKRKKTGGERKGALKLEVWHSPIRQQEAGPEDSTTWKGRTRRKILVRGQPHNVDYFLKNKMSILNNT